MMRDYTFTRNSRMEEARLSMRLTRARAARKTALCGRPPLFSLRSDTQAETSRCCPPPCTFVILQNRLAPYLRPYPFPPSPVTFELYAFIADTLSSLYPSRFFADLFAHHCRLRARENPAHTLSAPNFSRSRSYPDELIPAAGKRRGFLSETRMTATAIVTFVPITLTGIVARS